MKSLLILLISVLVFYSTATAQYRCFMPGQRQFFVNDDAYLRGIEVTNVQSFTGYSIYSLFKTPRGRYGVKPYYDTLTARGSWMGEDVIVYDDGMHTIETIWGDTVYIKSQAQLGEEWVFHAGSIAPEYFMAKVIGIDTSTVLGVLDSVKSIRISAYQGSSPVADLLNGLTFKLSKNHGFVQAFELYTFPYHAPAQPIKMGDDYYFDKMGGLARVLFKVCSYEPALNKLYDWQVGDVLEYSATPYGVGPSPLIQVYYLDTIVSKQQGIGWVSYDTRGWRSDKKELPPAPNKPQPNIIYEKTPTAGTQYYNDNWAMADDYMPEQINALYLLYYKPADTGFCITGRWYRSTTSKIEGFGNGLYLYKSGGLGDHYYNAIYKERLGLVEYFSGSTDMQKDTTLIYAVLNGKPCGHFINLSAKEVEINDNGISISPNPAQDIVTIEMPAWTGKAYTLTVTDVMGARVISMQSSSSKTQLDIRQLPAGAYMLSLQTGKDVIHHKLVKY